MDFIWLGLGIISILGTIIYVLSDDKKELTKEEKWLANVLKDHIETAENNPTSSNKRRDI